MGKKIGLMVGREWSFPPAFIDEIGRRAPDLEVEYVKLATPRIEDVGAYDVILDRISHSVPFYRTFLKHAALRGVRVINNPFVEAADDRFTAATLAARAGIRIPKMVLLPHREYAEGIVHEESLRNLDYPLDWAAVLDYVGTPCIVRDANGVGDWVHVCNSVEELLHHYNGSGQRLLMVQELIEWQRFVRCFVIDRKDVLTLRYDPWERRYHVDHEHLTADLGQQVVDDSLRLVDELGYDVDTVDWAIRDGVAYAVEFLNPVPEIDIYALTPHYFEWVVEHLADAVIRAAREVGDVTPAGGLGEPAPGGRTDGPRVGAPRAADGAGDLAEELGSLARGLPKSEIQPD